MVKLKSANSLTHRKPVAFNFADNSTYVNGLLSVYTVNSGGCRRSQQLQLRRSDVKAAIVNFVQSSVDAVKSCVHKSALFFSILFR